MPGPPALETKQDPYDSKGYTHTPPRREARFFKLRAEREVRLSELTDLTVGLIGSQWESELTNGIVMKAGSDCM